MQTPKKPVSFMLIVTGIILVLFLVMQPLQVLFYGEEISLLFPAGSIAVKQRNLWFIIQALMLLVIVPVYILTFIFSWRYRSDNTKATYDPDLVDHKIAEIIWWGVPLVMVLIIGAITWVKTHELDPYKPIVSDKKTLNVQVVALQWKWLFIYPEQKIATVNYLQIPVGTPVRFDITADAPMNSFWIPDLGGQIYAMAGMQTQLHLIADETGEFRGSSANISGEGFAGMHFVTKASTEKEFQDWVTSAKASTKNLDFIEYEKLAAPSQNDPVALYQVNDDHIFHQILMKYMEPPKSVPLKPVPEKEITPADITRKQVTKE